MKYNERLFSNVNPEKYMIEPAEFISYYIYRELISKFFVQTFVHKHYKVNNDFVSQYICPYCNCGEKTEWLAPSYFYEDGLMLIGKMSVSEEDSLGTVVVRIFDSAVGQHFYICDDDIMQAIYLAGEGILKNIVVFEHIYKFDGQENMGFSFFYTKNKVLLESLKEFSGSVEFCDCDCTLFYRAVRFEEYISITRKNYSFTYFKNKRILSDFLKTLSEYFSPTEGLIELNKSTIKLFNELFDGNNEDTLSERKLFFRELGKPRGPLWETQKGSDFLLRKLKELCNKIGIKFWLYSGTLLGAMRHGGFIPWDDDVDVGIMRNDLHKLIEYLKDDEYFSIEILYNTEWADRIYKFKFKNTYYPVYVDLFPFDYCSGDASKVWYWFRKLKAKMVQEFLNYEQHSGNEYRQLFDIPEKEQDKINALFDKFYAEGEDLLGLTKENTGKIIYGYDTVFLIDWLQVFDLDEVMPFSYAEFNGEQYYTFKNADEVLTCNYSAPYTVPDDIISHRHTARMTKELIEQLNALLDKLKDYKFTK